MSNELTKLDNLDNLELKSFEQVFDLADRLSKAGGFLPKIFEGKPGAVLACILKGRELGFTTMASFSALFVMNFKGDFRIGIYADAQLALLVRRGYKHEWGETTDKIATIKLTYPGRKDFELSYTIDEATTANLAGKDIWKAYPAQMLRARATSAAARAYAPEVMHGIYSKEELDDMQSDEKVIQVQVDSQSGTETALAAFDAKYGQPEEVKVLLEDKNQGVKEELEDGAKEVNVLDEDGSLTDSFVTLNDMMDEAKCMDDLMAIAEQIKDGDISEKEKEILRAKFSERKGQIQG